MPNPFSNWLSLAPQIMWLGLEAQQVIALRAIKLGAGGAAAQAELARMMTEKVVAATEAAGTLWLGGSGQKVVRRYRTRVRQNVRRLSKSSTTKRR
jgi:hypothetical protein